MNKINSMILLIAKSIILLFFYFIFTNTLEAQQNLIFAKKEGIADDYIAEFILKRVYERINIEVEFRTLPPSRALIYAREGIVDGEVQRILLDEVSYSTLVRVPTSHNYVNSCVFFKEFVPFTSLDDFSDYRFVYVRGVESYKPIVPLFEQSYEVGSDEQMWRMIDMGRADLALAGQVNGIITLMKMGITDIYALEPPVRKEPLYHYLHEKHRDLVPAVNRVLQQMEETGELAELRSEAVQNMFNSLSESHSETDIVITIP